MSSKAPKPSKQTFIVAGLPVHVFSKDPLKDVSGDVAVLFFLHGRMGSADGVEPVVHLLFEEIHKKVTDTESREVAKELIVVTYVST